MHWLDYVVLVGYFAVMAGIGLRMMRLVKAQEDYFMGGRSFGKIMQTFAAFGAGTGSGDPVNVARTTFTSGMSGMWSVMYWLFVTPFYWITGVWYRRMRHLTLGDWFVERYESRRLGAAYAVFGIIFYIFYASMLFSAIGKVAAPLIGTGTVSWGSDVIGIEYLLVPIIGAVVLLYGILGGLRAAYMTDVIQGVCIILLSVLLIPFAMSAIVQQYGTPGEEALVTQSFRLLHERLPAEYFQIVGSSSSSEFPLYRIIAVVVINLIGVVIQPHFIATGGGSAKSELNARVGLVVGNFLKRLCTVGWVVTALFALALFAGDPELAEDPDKTWGVASRELLGPGLSGLMLACLLAALMSSVDAYMIVGSALIVRNIYAAFMKTEATEREYVTAARITGALIVGGAVLVSLQHMNVFLQLQITWIIPVLFAAPFWVGMYWRRATTSAAWGTILFCAMLFFILPATLPRLIPSLRTSEMLSQRNQIVESTVTRPAAPSDVSQREAAQSLWDSYDQQIRDVTQQIQASSDPVEVARLQDELAELSKQLDAFGPRPESLREGERMVKTRVTGGQSVFWSNGIEPVDESGRVVTVEPEPVGEARTVSPTTEQQVLAYPADQRWHGKGNLRVDFLIYAALGVDLAEVSDAMLDTLELPTKIVLPFLVMIGLSWLTRSNSPDALDRYYAKMKTPVDPDPERDAKRLQAAVADPSTWREKRLFPNTNLEFQRPNWVDVVGVAACFAGCFAIVGLAIWVGRLGL